MKRNLLGLSLLAAVLFSCKKEHTTPNETQKTYNISFNVGFTQSTGAINNGTINLLSAGSRTAATVPDTLGNVISVLNYQVYDSNMHIVRYINQAVGDTAFGNISTELPGGTYTAIISAGGKNFGAGEYTGASAAQFAILAYGDPGPYLPPGTTAGYFTDAPFQANTFYKKFTLTVGSSGASYNVNLDRIVGQIEVIVQDRVPGDVKEIVVQVNGDAMDKNIFTLANDYYTGNYYYSYTSTIVTGAANTTFYIPIGNTATPFSVEIQATNGIPTPIEPFEPARVIYDDKTITGVTCANNKTTVLTGNLFTSGGNSNSGFTISYNPTWNTGSPTTINFARKQKSH